MNTAQSVDPTTINVCNERLTQDHKVLQARVDALADAFTVERTVRNGLLNLLSSLASADEVSDIRAQAKDYVAQCYDMINAAYTERTGEDLFGGDPNPTGL